MKPIRLALNAWSLMSTHTGIAAYTRNLAMALLERNDVEPLFFYGFSWSPELRAGSVPGIDPLKAAVKRLIPRPYALMRFMQQRCFDGGVRRYGFELYHEPSFLPFRFAGPAVITIHDLSPLRYPETHPKQRVQTVREQLPRAVERAAAIIVDSEAVRREVIETFGVSPERVNTIHLGVSAEYRPRTAHEAGQCLARYRLGYGRYVLAVGTLEPRKNLVAALDAYVALPEALRKSTPLVIAGMRGWLSAALENRIRIHEERGEVRWLGYVPAEDLPLLYSGASLLVYPSLYEGFGLPVLEAMASGIPVVTSNQSSLPEVAGDVGLTVDPEDVRELGACMRFLIEDKQEAARRGALGVERARQFTWQACAEKTLAVYKKAIRK